MAEFPRLQKASRIKGKTLVFRNATIADASFILSLRTDQRKGKHLSSTSPDLLLQVEWLKAYENKTNEAYFIIEDLSGQTLGTVRLYDPQEDSFCWGSWILKDGAPQYAAIESALIVYAYAVDNLGFKKAHFDVRKQNKSVWMFHERFGATRVGETESDYLYKIELEKIKSSQKHYRRYLSSSLEVEV